MRNRLRFDHYEALYRESVLRCTDPGVGNDLPETLTVSLTSFGTRIETVYLTIESLMQQSLKADRIVLTLDRNNFSEATLPAALKKQRDRGLEILFCEEDLGPYTKFYYTLQKYPDDLLITVDDDLVYPIDTLDQLYRAYQNDPDVVHCTRSHLIRFNTNGAILPYKSWKWDHNFDAPSLLIFPTGVGGVLYFPGCFDEEILNKKVFQQLARDADDIWLKAMTLLRQTKCRQVSDGRPWKDRYLQINHSQITSLKRKNKNGNDIKILNTLGHYHLLEPLKNENRSFR